MKRLLPGVGYHLYETADGVSLVIDETIFKQEEQVHPYKVQAVEYPTTGSDIKFGVYIGNIFGIGTNHNAEAFIDGKAWTIDEDNLRVRIGTTLTAIPGSSTQNSAYLDERNIGMKYSATMSTIHTNVLYVEIKEDSDAALGFQARLEVKTIYDAAADYTTNPPDTDFIEGQDKLKTENTWHDSPAAPTNPFEIPSVQFGNGTGNIQLTQEFNLYSNKHKRKGVYQVPVAYFRLVGDNWVVRQVLRSDIFFPYGLNTKTYYVGAHVDDFTGTCIA